MRNITKILFGLSLQLFALFCLIFAYAERENNEIAFPVFVIAAAAMIAGLIHTWSAYREVCRKTEMEAAGQKNGPNYVWENGKVVLPDGNSD